MGACAEEPPAAPVLSLDVAPIKQLRFDWEPVAGADAYHLLLSTGPEDPFAPLVEDIVETWIDVSVPLYMQGQATYLLQACNSAGCSESMQLRPPSDPSEGVGYFKSPVPQPRGLLGCEVDLSADGSVLAVGACGEASPGVDGVPSDDSVPDTGVVYLFERDDAGAWSLMAYVQAETPEEGDRFGGSVKLSADGRTLAVGAAGESDLPSGEEVDGSVGAVYVFVRADAGRWRQQAYLQAEDAGIAESFGQQIAMSDDGETLAVGVQYKDGAAPGGGLDESATWVGAAYVFVRSDGRWTQQAVLRASNADEDDRFGASIALSGDGQTLVVGSTDEASDASGIDGDQSDNSMENAGAAYVFARSGSSWSQQAYLKAEVPAEDSFFGSGVAIDTDGRTLVVGARREQGGSSGIGGDPTDRGTGSGAVFVFVRDEQGPWSQQAYLKAADPGFNDWFGSTVALSGAGDVLVVGAQHEDGASRGFGGDQSSDTAKDVGAAYVFVRDESGRWSQRSYLKAPNASDEDYFGGSVAISDDGHSVAVGATEEDGGQGGIGGDQDDDSVDRAGAVYLF